jgi:hypothetical protein
MPKISAQSKTFIALFCFAVVGTYLCLLLWANSAGNISVKPNSVTHTQTKVTNVDTAPTPTPVPTTPAVDTSGWKTYNDSKDGLSFLYKPGWKVLPAVNKDGYIVLQIDPGSKYYNIKIYINPKEFYVMDGLPTKTETIDGQTALNVNDALYGIEANKNYYTFDVGMSMSLVPDFSALVHTVKF